MPPAALTVSEDLIRLFQATTASTDERPDPRAILVHNEQSNTVLTQTGSFSPSKSANEDFTASLRQLLADEPNRSAYILFRLDSTAAAGTWEWLLCCYQPPAAPIREKMKYSQTKAALVQALHELNFLDVIYGQTPAEFTFPTRLRNARKTDYQNPNVGLQGRPAAQAAGASTGGVRRNFGQAVKTHVPGSMPTSAPVPVSAARPTKSYAGATPTPLVSSGPAQPAAAAAEAPAPTILKEEEKESVKEQTQPEAPVASEKEETPPTSTGIPLPKTALQAAESAEQDDDDDDWDGPAALQDSRVPSPVQVGHVAEAPKLDTVEEERAAQAAAAAASQQQGPAAVEPDALERALVAEQEKAASEEMPVPEAPTLAPKQEESAPKQEEPASSLPEVTERETAASPEAAALERPQEPIAAVLEDSTPDPAAAERIVQADDTPLDTSDGVIASTEVPVESSYPVTSQAPDSDSASMVVEPPTPAPLRAEPDESASPQLAKTPVLEDAPPLSRSNVEIASLEGLKEPTSLMPAQDASSDSASMIVEPPTPAPAREELDVVTPRAAYSPLASPPIEPLPPPSATLPPPETKSAAPGQASPSAGPISVSGYGTKAGDSLLTEEEAIRAEVDRASAAERASFTPPVRGGLGPGHTTVSFEWEEEVLPALSTLPIRASGASEYNFVLLSLNLTPGEERVELQAPPRFLPAAEVGQALASENGPRYALYRLEGTPVFADDDDEASTAMAKPARGRRSSSSPIAMTGGGLLFIYSCPSSSSVRERMLYSTNLRSFHHLAEQRVAGLKVHKRVETSDPAELTASFLASELDRVLGGQSKEANSSAGQATGNDGFGGSAAADGVKAGSGPLLSSTQAFSRPKRPGGKR
ncbi:hypothetical protein CF327_g421 [Tilletia walkeri]|nr:hypothetical protein CF327_g421 [Tilletia walkeri]